MSAARGSLRCSRSTPIPTCTAFPLQGGRGYAEVSILGVMHSVIGMLDHVPLAVLRARLVLGLVHDVHADRLAPSG